MNSEKTAAMKTKYFMWRVAAWTGLAYPVGLGICWVVFAHLLPPPPESLSAQEITRFYLDNNMGLRIGMVGILLFSPFYFVWSSVISRIMQRIEGPDGVLSNVELMGGVMTVVATLIPASAWLVASFRTAQRTPEIIQMLNDFGWVIFMVTFMVTVLQQWALGLAVLIDRRAEPLMPKWFGWFTIAAPGMFFSATLMTFDQTGPFSWTGLLTFWGIFASFFIWICPAIYFVLAAVNKLEREEQS